MALFSFRRFSASTIRPDGDDANPGTENGYFLSFPSFAATAFYHHRVPSQPAALEPFLREVEQYSLGEYASALLQGADLSADRKQAVAAKLESYTGVPAGAVGEGQSAHDRR